MKQGLAGFKILGALTIFEIAPTHLERVPAYRLAYSAEKCFR